MVKKKMTIHLIGWPLKPVSTTDLISTLLKDVNYYSPWLQKSVLTHIFLQILDFAKSLSFVFNTNFGPTFLFIQGIRILLINVFVPCIKIFKSKILYIESLRRS